MKTDESILKITVAAIHRHSIGIETWTRTTWSTGFLFPATEAFANELPIVQFVIDESNWTQITTRRVMCSVRGKTHDVHFDELDDVIWGDDKSSGIDHTQFRLIDFNGDQYDFWIETGKPAIAIIYSVDTISGLYKSGT